MEPIHKELTKCNGTIQYSISRLSFTFDETEYLVLFHSYKHVNLRCNTHHITNMLFSLSLAVIKALKYLLVVTVLGQVDG